LLDEVGDMPLPAQVKLLRFLQERCIQRVGGRETIPIDVRVLAATHRDLEVAIAEQQFREDLFYRLNVVTITLPPLRQRADDVPALVHYFLRRYGAEFELGEVSIQPDALSFLAEQPWPGNVRELENAVRKALLSARGYSVGLAEVRAACAAAHLSPALAQPFAQSIAELLGAASRGEIENVHATVLADAERELLAQAIKLAAGNQAKAARWLGISRLTLREKLTTYGLHPTQGHPRESAD
jgi:DNA-binding NtrC family response regulator